MEIADKSDMLVKVQKCDVPVFKKNQPDDTNKYLPAPSPTGTFPYRLALETIQPVVSDEKMVFHVLGDTGSMRNPDFIKYVVGEMVKQYEPAQSEEEVPQFLFHLGDIVYNHGEAEQYKRQFFEPYKHYPAPIFAIAGNHDSDVNPDNQRRYKSLDAFKAVFCDTTSRTVSFSGNADRKSMTQPNIYWTLETPLANIIGMHSNVPKFGVVMPEQRSWLVNELKNADKQRPNKAVILCIHHSPYSADINHGSSVPMIELLEGVFKETGIKPDIVLSGHVHNYQRFVKSYPDGHKVPFVVAGAGGYDELHSIARTDDKQFTTVNPLFEGVHLQNFCDDQHGFLKITLEKDNDALTLIGEYFTIPQTNRHQKEYLPSSVLADRFVIQI